MHQGTEHNCADRVVSTQQACNTLKKSENRDNKRSPLSRLLLVYKNATAWLETPDGKLAFLFSDFTDSHSDAERRVILRKMLYVLKIDMRRAYTRLYGTGVTIEDLLLRVLLKSTKRLTAFNQGEPDPAWLITAWSKKSPAHAPYFFDKTVKVEPIHRNVVGYGYLRRSLLRELGKIAKTSQAQSNNQSRQFTLLTVDIVKSGLRHFGISQGQLARAIGVTRPFITQILNKTRPFPKRRQQQILNHFNALHKNDI